MQCESGQIVLCFPEFIAFAVAMNRVSDNRVMDVSKVPSHLMISSGFGKGEGQGATRFGTSSDALHIGQCFFGFTLLNFDRCIDSR